MKDTQDQDATPSSNGEALNKDSSDSLHMISLAIALRDFAQRLSTLESRIEKAAIGASKSGNTFVEVLKVLLGGWPALGLLFLLLFYSPLRDALNAIPEKVKAADEIGVMGVSLKSTIRAEAARLGANNLSETIPNLSAAAIELLLRAPRNPASLISYTPNDRQEYEIVRFPSKSIIASISELQGKGFVVVHTDVKGTRSITGDGIVGLISEFQRKYPGKEQAENNESQMAWHPRTPLPRATTQLPILTWDLTDLGKKAVEVVLKAVAMELDPAAGSRPKAKSAPRS